MATSENVQRVRTMIRTLGDPREYTWGHDRVWMVGRVRDTEEVGLPVNTWTQKYLTSLSLGPWRIQGQVAQKNLVLSVVGDSEFSTLSSSIVARLPFRFHWQKSLAKEFHRSVRASGKSLDILCEQLRKVTGDEAYRHLATMSGVKAYSKCLDFFVREGLSLDRVPVDRHVKRILAEFGLSAVRRSQLPQLIREAGFNPRFVARALYEQGVLGVREQTSVKTLYRQLGRSRRTLFPKTGERLEAPSKHAVYIIFKPGGTVVHVGRSIRGKKGLRQRLNDHLHGNSSFVSHYAPLRGKGSRLRGRYSFSLIEVSRPRTRALLEAYAVGCLCPKHLGVGKNAAKPG